MSNLFEILDEDGNHLGFFEENTPFDFDGWVIVIRKVNETPELRECVEVIKSNEKWER